VSLADCVPDARPGTVPRGNRYRRGPWGRPRRTACPAPGGCL